ncbi:MAG: hypothetical protein ACOC00_00135 [Halothiobacillaceae bacterium]
MQTLKAAFDAGELDPSLHAAVDTELYQRGAKRLRNFYTGTPAGIEGRPGTEWIADIHAAGTDPSSVTDRQVLIPFVYSATDRYVLAFDGDGTMRVIKENGDLVEDGLGNVYTLSTSLTDLAFGYSYTQVADSIWICDAAGCYKLVRVDEKNWTVAGVDTGVPASEYTDPADTRIIGVHQQADSSNFKYEGAIYVDAQCPDGYTRKLDDATAYWISGTWGGNDVMFAMLNVLWDYASHWTQSPSDANVYYWDAQPFTDADVIDKLSALYAYKRPFGTDSSEIRQLVRTTADSRPSSDWEWCFNDHDTLGFDTFYVRLGGGSSPGASSDVDLLCYAFSGARYDIFMSKTGGTETVGYVASTTLPIVEWEQEPTPDPGVQPYTDYRPVVNGITSKEPVTVCAAFQRLWWGGTDAKPATIEASALGDLAIHGRHTPPIASDGMELAIASEAVNQVRWIIKFDSGVLVFTSGSLYLVTGTTGGVQTAAVNWLCDTEVDEKLQPITIANTVLWCDRYNRVMELTYSDERKAYWPIDRTEYAKHLFGYNRSVSRVVSWSYSELYGRLYATLANGTMLTARVMIGAPLWPWTWHDTGKWSSSGHDTGSLDRFLSVCCVGDEVFLSVYRTRGTTSTASITLERMRHDVVEQASEGWFLDCAKYYFGNVRVVTGLDHLEGYAVMALADGNALGPFIVSSGTITLHDSDTYQDVVVGLPYAVDLVMLPIGNYGNQLQGKPKSVGGADVALRDTRDIDAGPTADKLKPQAFRDREAYDEATNLYTGIKHIAFNSGWNNTGEFMIRQGGPFPVKIDAVMPEVRVAGR